MRLFDFRRAPTIKVHGRPPQEDGDTLEIDDLLSRGSDGLGLDVDSEGNLVLFEGVDFD